MEDSDFNVFRFSANDIVNILHQNPSMVSAKDRGEYIERKGDNSR